VLLFAKPSTTTKFRDYSFCFAGPAAWNSLPDCYIILLILVFKCSPRTKRFDREHISQTCHFVITPGLKWYSTSDFYCTAFCIVLYFLSYGWAPNQL